MQHVWLYTDLLQALKGEPLSSVFSTDGTWLSAFAALHCRLSYVCQMSSVALVSIQLTLYRIHDKTKNIYHRLKLSLPDPLNIQPAGEKHVLEPIYIPQAPKMGTCINYLWWWARRTVLFCRPAQKPVFATADRKQKKLARGCGENEVEWTRTVVEMTKKTHTQNHGRG